MSRIIGFCLSLSLLLIFVGCGKETQVESTVNEDTEQSAPAVVPNEVSAAHILIMHENSESPSKESTRTKEEALALAQDVAKKAQADDADFSALAKEFSEGPSGPNGGNLGVFPPQAMVKPFSEALVQLEVGQVSDPVETQFGYHIIRRLEVLKASAKHILVMYAGSERAPGDITRTKEEALARMNECLDRAKKDEKFEDLATEYSDCPSSAQGGDLGEFPKGVMAGAFDEAVFNGEVGKLTGIVETPFGYHIILRYK